MNPPPDPLDRLFRAAARSPRRRASEVPFAVEAAALAGLRQGQAGSREADDWFAFLPIFRAGLAVAAAVALLALAVSFRVAAPPEADEIQFLAPVQELTYAP